VEKRSKQDQSLSREESNMRARHDKAFSLSDPALYLVE